MKNENSVVGGVFWKLSERLLAQGITFVLSIILARLVAPDDFGVISIVMIFITFADVFVSNGFATALIQKKDANETDFSTIFYCSLSVSVIIYAILFIAAPYIADFYENQILVPVIRVFFLRMPLSALNSIQHAYISRHMQFKKFFFSTLAGTLLSAVVGVIMAYCGFGVWAIVAQYLTNTIVDSIVLLFTTKWYPHLVFSKSSAKTLMSYGWKVTATSFIGTFFNQLRSLIIGKYYTLSDLAYYERGRNFSALATDNIGASLMAVLFPKFANSADNKKEVKWYLRKAVQVITYILFPMIIGMMLVAEPMILILLTDKWIECVPYLQILSLSAAVGLVGDVCLQALNAIGRSDSMLKIEFIKKPIYLFLLIIGIQISVKAVAVTMLIYSAYATFINIFPLRKHLNYHFRELIKDLGSSVILSLIMAICVFSLRFVIKNQVILIVSQVTVGVCVYVGLSAVIKESSFMYILDYVKGRIKK